MRRLFAGIILSFLITIPAHATPWWWAQFTKGDGINTGNSGFERWMAFIADQGAPAADTTYVCSYTWGSGGIGSINGVNAGNTAGLNNHSAAGFPSDYLIGDGDGGAGLTNAQGLSDANVIDVTEPAGGTIMHIKDIFVENKGYVISSGNHTAGGWNSQNNNAIYFPWAAMSVGMRAKIREQMAEMAAGTFHDASQYAGGDVFYSPYGDTIELRYSPEDNDGGTGIGTGSILSRLRQLATGARESIFFMSDAWSSGAGQISLRTDIVNNNSIIWRGVGGGTGVGDWDATTTTAFEGDANGTLRDEAGAFNRLHSKTFIFDMEWVATGSANMTGAATYTSGSNDEVYVIVNDFRLARKYMQHYHKIMNTAMADPSADAYEAVAPAGATALTISPTDTAFYASWTPSATTDVSRYYLFIDTAVLTQNKIGDRADNDADGYVDEDPRGDYDRFSSGATAAGKQASDDDADGAVDEDLWMAPEVMVKGRASNKGVIRKYNVNDTLLAATNYYFGIVSVDTQGNEGTIATAGPFQLSAAAADTRLVVLLNSLVADTTARQGETNVIVANIFIRGETSALQDTLTLFAVKNLGTSDSRDMTVRLWRDEDSNARITAADTMLAQLIYSNTTRRFQTTFVASDTRVRLGTTGKTFLVTLDVFDTAGVGDTFQAQIDAKTCSSPRRDSGPAAALTNTGKITFTFVDATAPGVFALTSPADLSETRSSTITLRWADAVEDSSPPVRYEVQVDTAGTFLANVIDTTGLSDTFVVVSLPRNDTYSWRVIARDLQGNARNSAATWRIVFDTMSPVAGALIVPVNLTDTTATTFTFQWNAASDTGSGISGYRLQIDTANTFIAPLVDSATPLTSGIRTLAANDTYYWRILAVDDAGNTRAVTANRLRVDTAGPVVGALTGPSASLDTKSRTIKFTWTAAVDAITGLTGYRLQVDTSNTFSSFVIDSATPLLTLTPTLAVNDTYYWRVLALDTLQNTSIYPSRRLRIDTTTPPPALLITKNGDTFTGVVSLAWAASQDSISGLSFYIVQVDTAGTFVSLKDSATHVAGDTLHLFSLPISDTYYWRVLSYDSAGNFSASLPLLDTFRTLITDTSPPSAFNLTAPADLTETSLTTLMLRWQDAIDIGSPPVRYRIQIDRLGTFAAPYFDSSGLIDTFISAPFRINDTSSWRVIASDNSGNTVAVVAVRRVVVDTAGPLAGSLTTPVSPTDTRSTSITFRWNAASDTGTGVGSYRLQIDTSNTFAAPFVDSATGLALLGTRTLPANDTYYWRAVAVDDAGNTTAVASNLIRIDTRPPLTGTLIAPASPHDTTATTMTFAWTSAPDSISPSVTYRLQVSRAISFTPLLVDSTTPLTTGSRTLTSNDTYYWRVIAVDNAGNTVAYSPAIIRIDTAGPTAPVSTSPATLLDTTSTQLTFAWTASTDTGIGSVTYELQIDVDGLFTSNLIDTIVTASSVIISTLPANDLYYWRVVAIDSLGNSTAGAMRSFRIDTAPPTQALLTAFGGDSVSPSITLAWSLATDSVTSVVFYVVQVDTSGTFASLVESATVIDPDTDRVSALAGVDTYFWRVLAYDSAGNISISATDSFLLTRSDTVPPSAFVMTSPSHGSLTTSPSIAFQWTNATDDSSPPVLYNLQVDTSGVFTANVVDTSWLTDTFVSVTLAANATYYWRVIARDNALNTTAVSSSFRFSIDTASPSAPALTVQSGAQVSSPAYLTWSAASDSISGVRAYLVQVDNSSGFTNPLIDSVTQAPPDTDFWTASLAADTYYWRVFAFDTLGNSVVSTPAFDSFRITVVDTAPPIFFSASASPSSVSNSGSTSVALTVFVADSVFVASVSVNLAPIGKDSVTALVPNTAVPSSDTKWTVTTTFETTVVAGSYDLVVTAIDGSNYSSTTTVSVTVTDNSPSTTDIISMPVANLVAGGTSLSIVSAYGDSYSGVQYEYRTVSPLSAWMVCTAAAQTPNPDTVAPFWGFFWSIGSLPNGLYDVRSVGTRNGVVDPSPGFIRVTINQTDSVVHEYVDTGSRHIRRQEVKPDTNSLVLIADGTSVSVPTGSVETTVWMKVVINESAPVDAPISSNLVTVGSGVFREFTRQDGLRTFPGLVTITLPYPDTDALDDVVGVLPYLERDLAIYRYDETLKVWIKEPTSTVDPRTNTVSAQVNHFTQFAVFFTGPGAADLKSVVIYPNPFVPHDGNDANGKPFNGADVTSGIIFDSMPEQATVEIYNLAGRRVATFSKSTGGPRAHWDAYSDDHRELASGMYIAIIRSNAGEQITRKIMIIR